MDPHRKRFPSGSGSASASSSAGAQGGSSAPATQPGASRIQQPKPQALPTRQGPSSILVSPRQKGNPILNHIQSVPWEYSDIPADYVLGGTTCALFLSLKYHRLHPEYIYARIRALAGKYRLRVLLTMVDIENHDDPLKELSKTSLINNLTLILCWSAAEAGRYLSLFKTYEHASPTSIRAQQATGYSDKLVEFVTVPKSINKTDAISLVGNFGSLRAAVNAHPEEIALVGGWGDKKVANWSASVQDGFRVKKAKKRGAGALSRETTREEGLDRVDSRMEEAEGDDDDNTDVVRGQTTGRPPVVPLSMVPSRETTRGGSGTPDANQRPPRRLAEDVSMQEPGSDEEEALFASLQSEDQRGLQKSSANGQQQGTSKTQDEEMGEGIMAALAKLREKG